jgi:radical SAM/Cys-rich protein
MHATLPLLKHTDFPPIRRKLLDTLQVNLGYYCNQACVHCHVAAGPQRTEMMDDATVDLILPVLRARRLATLDITGGAPEFHPRFRALAAAARALGVRVIDRSNLTVLSEPGQEDLAAFLAAHKIDVIASLPCYTRENVDQQRGAGTFDRSIAALRQLNALGYGHSGTGLTLDLIYNPQGPTLPPAQHKLEADYRRELAPFGIVFHHLYVLTNMPIQRFGSMLVSRGQFDGYMKLLKDNYHAPNLDVVMCRNLVSVDWRGNLYDCDFNQMLNLPLRLNGKPRVRLRDLLDADLDGKPITIADHCYGCTAGQGSSCAGALT